MLEGRNVILRLFAEEDLEEFFTLMAKIAGKTAHYVLRWVATTGEKGPWSETASATIGA